MGEAALPGGKRGGKWPQLCSSPGEDPCLIRQGGGRWGDPGKGGQRGRYSHVPQLGLPPHQDLPDPLDFEELPFDVVDGGGGVGHGNNLILCKRNGSHVSQQEMLNTC